MANGAQSKFFGVYLFKVEPQCFFRIVVGLQFCFVADFTDEERIEMLITTKV